MANLNRGAGRDTSPDHISDSIIADAHATIETLQQRVGLAAQIAFSGGKDSIVAAHIASQHGIKNAICETSFCFSDDVADFRRVGSELGLRVEYRQKLSWEWLARHPEFIFAPLKKQAQFYSIRQQATIKSREIPKGPFLATIMGRRTQENTVPSKLYQTKSGCWQCHPLRDWKVEDVWSYIHRFKLPYPSSYDKLFGYVEGASSWFIVDLKQWERIGYTPHQVFQIIYDRQPEYVRWGAQYNEQLREFIESIGDTPGGWE